MLPTVTIAPIAFTIFFLLNPNMPQYPFYYIESYLGQYKSFAVPFLAIFEAFHWFNILIPSVFCLNNSCSIGYPIIFWVGEIM